MKLIHRTRWGACLAVGALVVAGATSAHAAAITDPLPGSTFEGGDGNLKVDVLGHTDWNTLPSSMLNVGIDKASGSSDNSFGQGTKEDNSAVTVVTGSIPPNKNDLTRFYEASETTGPDDHTFLYLAWERLVNIGNANLDFEISKTSNVPTLTPSTTGAVTINRTAGDLLVTYDFGGSGTPTIGINTWLTAANGDSVSSCYASNTLPCWGNHNALNGTDSQGAVNTASVSDTILGQDVGTGLFGEAAIDLTAAGVIKPGTCEAFGSAFVKSRSSSSFTAELKDFIAPIPVNINNCGSITIKKVTTNAPANDATSFAYTTTGLTPSTFNLTNGGSQVYKALPTGTYSVTEADQKAPWSFVGPIQCDSTAISQTGQSVTINLAVGQNVICTYTNHYMNSPTIATTLSANPITVGGSASDSATLTGASATAGGNVTYNVYTDSKCTTLLQSAGTVTVTNGVVPGSNAVTFTAAGDYYWQAVYSGDGNDNPATSVCTDEHLVVNKAQPTASTAQNLLPNDKFTLSGGYGTPTGTITFNLYPAGDTTCSLQPVLTQTVTVNGTGDYVTTNTTFLATAGTWNWASSYSGDGNNLPASSACGVEHFTVIDK